MTIIEREDLPGKLINATLKGMPTGEVVARLRTNVDVMNIKRVSITKAALWDDPRHPPWQKAHFHRGVTEHYLLVSGAMLLVWRQGGSFVVDTVCDNEKTFRVALFEPNVSHNVLLSPGAEILVWHTGTPVMNMQMRKQEDRFPDEQFGEDLDYSLLFQQVGRLLDY